jgi:hypothetical protein
MLSFLGENVPIRPRFRGPQISTFVVENCWPKKKTRLGGCRKKKPGLGLDAVLDVTVLADPVPDVVLDVAVQADSVPDAVLDVAVQADPILDAVLANPVPDAVLDVAVQADLVPDAVLDVAVQADPIIDAILDIDVQSDPDVVVQIEAKLAVEVQTEEVWMFFCKLKNLCVLRRCTVRGKL